MSGQLLRRCWHVSKKLQAISQLSLSGLEIVKSTTSLCHNTLYQFHQARTFANIYEPEYLDPVGHQVPKYDLLNIQLKGYDFSVLETFQSFVHKTVERIGLDVEDGWGVPAKKLKITKLKPESTVIETEYQLKVYERTVQIADLPTTALPIIINIVQTALPVGVTMNVKEHEQEDAEIRYIPDLELKDLKEQLTMDSEMLKKKKIKFSLNFK